MPLRMKEMPEAERPYEKLEIYGERKLSNAELLAIIIKTGTKEENSLQLANRILNLTNSLDELTEKSVEELIEIKGIGKVKAIQIKAACELARRMENNNSTCKKQVKSPKDIADIFMNEYKFEKQEILKLVILNSKNYVIKIRDIVKGEENVVSVSMKQILAEAIKTQSTKIIIIHNHPSGDPNPSKQDYELTKRLISAADLLGIQLLDHIVIGNNCYESIFSRREFKNEVIGL